LQRREEAELAEGAARSGRAAKARAALAAALVEAAEERATDAMRARSGALLLQLRRLAVVSFFFSRASLCRIRCCQGRCRWWSRLTVRGVLCMCGVVVSDFLCPERVVVVLRDRKNVFGTLRSFDSYASVVLEDAFERIYVGGSFGDVPLEGWFIVRAENVILLGELDESEKDVAHLKRVDSKHIKELQKVEIEKERARRKILSEMDEVNQDEF
jgi:U6 snRNA-associated Sm-like protein LSm1